ncbi:MAG: hypothetical protein MUF18_20225, partial [Fimbriiglobus sp.]|nr:hypothetical protein [Fimbriiglobus sp.]
MSPVTAEGQIGGENKATLDANEFDLSALAPALRHFAPDVAAGGKLRGKFAASWSPAEQGLPAFTADGELHISQMVLSAPALGDRPVQLASAAMPLSATFDGKVLKVARWNVTCDVGTLGFAGEYDTTATPETLLNQTGLSFDADIDLAKLGRVAPGLLRLKPGTELTRGRVTATMASRKAAQGVTWSGSVLASKVEGVQGGRAVSWDQPLSVTFAGRVRADGLPVFDDLVVQSDFIGARAAGEPENFDAIANVNLDVLSRHLEELLDLNGLKLQGEGKNLLVKVRSKSGGGYTLTADGTVRNLVVRDNSGVLVSDPSLVLSATAEGDIKGGTIRIDTGRAGVTAGTDVFTVTLLEPIADAKALRSGKAAVAFSGDLDRWRGRVGRLAGWPKDWAIAGTVAEANATVSLGDALTVEKAKVVVHNAQFRGCGLAVDEQFLQVNTAEPNGRITLDPKTGTVGLALCEVRSETVSGAVAKFDLTPNPNGGYGMAGKANVVA